MLQMGMRVHFLAGCLSMHAFVFAQDLAFDIVISNIEHPKGQMMTAVFDQPSGFLSDDVVYHTIVPVGKGNTLIVPVPGLKRGDYAISVFHDVNGNGKLDKNFIGIPTEPYGFSNNARGTFGPPKFEAAKFLLHRQHQVVEITLH